MPLRIFRFLFLKWTYGYGSRPLWLLPYSVGVIIIFALAFAPLTIPRRTKSGIYVVHEGDNKGGEKNKKEELLPLRKGLLLLSLLSFSTFGYGAL